MKTAVWMSPIDHQLEIFTSSEDNLIARKMIILGYQSKLSRCNMLNKLLMMREKKPDNFEHLGASRGREINTTAHSRAAQAHNRVLKRLRHASMATKFSVLNKRLRNKMAVQ